MDVANRHSRNRGPRLLLRSEDRRSRTIGPAPGVSMINSAHLGHIVDALRQIDLSQAHFSRWLAQAANHVMTRSAPGGTQLLAKSAMPALTAIPRVSPGR